MFRNIQKGNSMSIYLTSSPVLFLIFNRPDVTFLVFEQIRKTKPKKLYIAADGSRSIEEEELCKKTRTIIENIDWECEVQTLFREVNFGCKVAVSSAIDWFFEHEEQGIILEDDCLPSLDFFRFCDEMLERYKLDSRIRFIGGSNFQFGNKRGDSSYYFSNLTHVWGWASWRRVWNDYDVNLNKYRKEDHYTAFLKVFNNEMLAQDWKNIIDRLYKNEINTWDYQLSITNLFNNGLSVIPNVNLISNIGFDKNATHTFEDNGFSDITHQSLDEETKHPILILPDREADFFTLNMEHKLEERAKEKEVIVIKKKRPFKKLKFWKK